MSWPFLFIAALYSLNPVTISVYPTFGMVPHATFRLTVFAPRHAENRHLCVGYRFAGERFQIRESCQPMAGANAARTRTVEWRVDWGGDYEAVAILTRVEQGRERTYTDRHPFRVLGLEP